MKKLSVLLMTAVISLGMAQLSMAEGKADKAATPVSCKKAAKASGLTDKKDIKNYVKECKKTKNKTAK